MMALNAEQMEKIIADEVLGRKPRIKGKEADEFRRKIRPDIEFVKKNGGEIYIPPEIPD